MGDFIIARVSARCSVPQNTSLWFTKSNQRIEESLKYTIYGEKQVISTHQRQLWRRKWPGDGDCIGLKPSQTWGGFFVFFYSVPGGRVKLTIPLQSDSVGVTTDTPLDPTKKSNILKYFADDSSNGTNIIAKEYLS